MAYTDINKRTLDYINNLGGLDGLISDIDGNTIIFTKQQYYTDYATPDDAWQEYTVLYASGLYDQGAATDPSAPPPQNTNYPVESFDNGYTVPGGYAYDCTNTYITTNYIKAETTVGMQVNDPIWFTGEMFGGITKTGDNGLTQIYYVTGVATTTCTATASGTNLITCTDATYLNNGDAVWFTGTTFGGVNALTASNAIQQYYVKDISGTTFKISLTQGGATVTLSSATGSMILHTRYFTVSTTKGGANATLSTQVGDMIANFGDTRMAIYTISVDPTTAIVTLTPTQLTAPTQYTQIVRGRRSAGAQLYYPISPAQGYTLINWLSVPESSSNETTFDGASMAFEQPLDMYDPTDRDDKYLVFPKANILV